MRKDRLLSYTDAIIAILITIMVLDFKTPHSGDWINLWNMRHIFLSYGLSFLYISIYWNNHHHSFHLVNEIDGSVLWLNNGFIFCLSFIPFATSWMAENHFAHNSVIFYGIILLVGKINYYLLLNNLKTLYGNKKFSYAFSNNTKDILSISWYIIGIILELLNFSGGIIMYFLVALLRIIPEKRVEQLFKK